MKILMLTPYLPFPLFSGGQIRTYNLLKNLSKKHTITLFSLIKNTDELKYVSELEQYCSEIRVFKRSEKPFTLKNIFRAGTSPYPFLVVRNLVPEVKSAVSEAIKQQSFDVIHAETFYMMPNIPRTKIPVILVEQTIEYLGYESYARSSKLWPIKPLLYFDIFRIKYWEEYFWKNSSRLIAMSDQDRTFMTKTCANVPQIDVVENGIDQAFFEQKKKKQTKQPTVLSVGTFKWLPNIEAVKYLLTDIWPRIQTSIPTAQLRIVGHSPTKEIIAMAEKMHNVSVDGNVADIRDAYAEADVLIAPVLSGKGTRYKVLEAMATETPVVGTPLAVEGLDLQNEKHALIASGADSLAEATVRLLKDAPLRKKLAQHAKQYVSQSFDWKLIASKLNSIYEDVATKSTT
jgi:glycosyltransferase involved in cell wall biosynthesis